MSDEPGMFASLTEKVTTSRAYSTGAGIVSWVVNQLWPVYSMGMIVAAVSLVGAVAEKQALADHMYGAATSDAVAEASQLAQASLDDETSHLVRSEIFAWSRAKFRAEALMADI